MVVTKKCNQRRGSRRSKKKQVYVGTMEEEGGLMAMVMVEAGVSEAASVVMVVVVGC